MTIFNRIAQVVLIFAIPFHVIQAQEPGGGEDEAIDPAKEG